MAEHPKWSHRKASVDAGGCRRQQGAVQAAMNSGVITSPGASSGTPGRICPDILRRGVANGMLQCQRGVRGKKRLCDGTGRLGRGWAAPAPRRAGGAFCAAAASITNRAAAKRSRAVSSSQGEVMASTLAPQDISVSNCQSRRSSSARAGPVSPAAAPLTRILPESWAKKPGWAETSSIPWQSTRRRRSGRTAPLNRCKRARPGGKPGIAVFGQQAGAAVQAGH